MASRVEQLNQFLTNNNLKGTITSSNGVIKLQIRSGKYDVDTYYLSETGEINSQYSSLPGAGGSGNDWKLDSKIMNGNVDISGTIITVEDRASSPEKISKTLEMGTKIAESLGGKITNLTTSEFSRSGGQGLVSTNEYAIKHPEVNISTTVLDGANLSRLDIQALIDKKTPVIYIEGSGCTGSVNILQKYEDLNLYYLVPKDKEHKSHAAVNADYQNNGIYEYFLGLEDVELSEYDIYKGSISEENKITQAELEEACGFKTYYRETSLKDATIGTTTSETATSTTLQEGTLAADLLHLYNETSALKTTLGKSYQTNTIPQTTSTAKIPASLASAQNSLLSIGKGISSNLLQEADIIENMADIIYQMDKDLTNKTENLSSLETIRMGNQINESLEKISYDDIVIPEITIFSETVVEGKAGQISVNEISELEKSLNENFAADQDDAKAIKTDLDNLVTILQSDNFKGDIWKNVVTKFNDYQELIGLRISSSLKLQEAYQNAMQLIKDYIAPDEMLDDGEIPELETKINELKKDRDTYQDKVDNPKIIHHKGDPKSGGYSFLGVYMVDVYEDTTEYQNKIKELNVQIEEFETQLKKLKGLAGKINEASAIIQNALNDIYDTYSKKAKAVFPGKATEYTTVADSDTTKLKETDVPEGTPKVKDSDNDHDHDHDHSSNDSEYTGETVIDTDSLSSITEETSQSTGETVATQINNTYDYANSSSQEENIEDDFALEEIDDDSYLDDELYEIDDTVIDDDLISIYNENNTSTSVIENTTATTVEKGTGLKKAGKVIGLGAALGAAGFGGYTIYKKHKENDDTE